MLPPPSGSPALLAPKGRVCADPAELAPRWRTVAEEASSRLACARSRAGAGSYIQPDISTRRSCATAGSCATRAGEIARCPLGCGRVDEHVAVEGLVGFARRMKAVPALALVADDDT